MAETTKVSANFVVFVHFLAKYKQYKDIWLKVKNNCAMFCKSMKNKRLQMIFVLQNGKESSAISERST